MSRSNHSPVRGDEAEAAIRHGRRSGGYDLGPLFDVALEGPTVAPVSPMASVGDHMASREAADRVAPISGALRARVLELIQRAGGRGMTDKELESLAEFAHFGFSTVRKRRSELFKAGLLEPRSTRDGASIWVATAVAAHARA